MCIIKVARRMVGVGVRLGMPMAMGNTRYACVRTPGVALRTHALQEPTQIASCRDHSSDVDKVETWTHSKNRRRREG
jgi:hypothetical protein